MTNTSGRARSHPMHTRILTRCIRAYHELGGNGMVTKMYEEVTGSTPETEKGE